MKHVTDSEIEAAAAILRNGGQVAFPTETVYGLGADATNPRAVAGIFALKARPSFDPLIVHVASADDLPSLVSGDPGDVVFRLARHFWPGPLTLVLPRSERVPDIVTAGLPTVGIRVPSHPVARRLLQACGFPIAAPSANRFGCLSPTCADHVRKQLPQIERILDGGETSVGLESTVVQVTGDTLTILRPGGIPLESLQCALPDVAIETAVKQTFLPSPGLLDSHYSPAKPLSVLSTLPASLPSGAGLIVHRSDRSLPSGAVVHCTSAIGDLMEIAANLFSALHQMEEDARVERIYIESVAEIGIGVAIMDRIRKAAFRWQ